MAETVGSHTIATFTSPVNGTTPIDANTVRGNDNVIQTAYNAHDTDPGIHIQSSALASRPAAGTAGRKWMTVDGTVQRLWYDTGSVWLEVQAAALSTARTLWGQSFDGSANVSGSLSSVTDIGMSGTLTIGGDVALSRGAANRLDLASGDNFNLVNGAYLIGAASVLSATTLGSSVVNSSLTGVGTLTSGAIGSGFSPIANSALANSSVTVNGVSIALGASGTVAAAASTLTGTTLASNVVNSSLTSVGTLVNLTVTNPISGSVTGSAGSVAASALTGTTLASGVTASSLTSVGTLTSLAVSGQITANGGVQVRNGSFGAGRIYQDGGLGLVTAALAGSTNDWTLVNPSGANIIAKVVAGTTAFDIVGNATVGGTLSVGSNLAVDTNTLFVDAVNNRVGVGTASPVGTLDVFNSAATNEQLYLRNNGTYHTGFIGSSSATPLTDAKAWGMFGGPNSYLTGIADAVTIALGLNVPNLLVTRHNNLNTTPTATLLNLTSSGNLGLGVTPSAWNAGYRAIEFSTGAAVWAEAGSNSSIYSSTNTTLDAGGTFRYKVVGAATMYNQQVGSHRWFTAASGGAGSAGNLITFTQAMTLTASGNLTIGGTNESARLRVEGTTNLSTALQVFRSGNSCGAIWQEASAMRFGTDGSTGFTEKLRIDATTTAGQTALLLWDVDNGTMERVTVGAADSGGTGFKVLRIPN